MFLPPITPVLITDEERMGRVREQVRLRESGVTSNLRCPWCNTVNLPNDAGMLCCRNFMLAIRQVLDETKQRLMLL